MSPLAETKELVEYKRMVDSDDRSSRKKSHHHHHHHHHHYSSSPDCRRVKFGQLLQQTAASEEERSSSNNNYEDQMSCHSYSSSRGSNASTAETTLSSGNSTSSSSSSPRLSSFNYTGASTTAAATDDNNYYFSSSPANHLISCSSPYTTTCQSSSPFLKSPWIKLSPLSHPTPNNHTTSSSSSSSSSLYFSRGRKCLIGSLLREEGHVYSLAVNDGMLYTGSESNNIRIWRNFQDAGGFKSGSGLVKAIVTCNHQQVFTGHQDGKIRIWTPEGKRLGSLPKFGDYIKSSMNPSNYVEVRRHHKVPKIKHFDAVSCMSLNQRFGLLYSGSWDKTIKVWRISDGKCLESLLEAHDDAINSIAVGYDGLVFSGSADGTVKVWRRELDGTSVKHFHVKTLLTQEYAVTALAVAADKQGWVLYAGSSDGLVNFWERDDEQDLVYGGVLRGHKLAVLCLATAGSLVFTGSTDKTICVWNREAHGDHSCLAVLSAHTGPVKCLAVEQDQDDDDDDDHRHNNQQRDWILYSGSLDKSVKIWRLSRHALLHQPITYSSPQA